MADVRRYKVRKNAGPATSHENSRRKAKSSGVHVVGQNFMAGGGLCICGGGRGKRTCTRVIEYAWQKHGLGE